MTSSFSRKPALFRILLALAMAALISTSARAQTKIATASLEKIFEGYYKTKAADQQLRENGAQAEKVKKGMLDDHQKATEAYKKLSADAADQAVSADEREKRKKAAEAKLIEIQEIERQVRQFWDDTSKRLNDQKLRMRDDVLRSIRERLTTKAKASGYNLVLDTSAKTINQTEAILFSAGLPDLTEEVLADLNAGAPPELIAAEKPEKPEEKKNEKK